MRTLDEIREKNKSKDNPFGMPTVDQLLELEEEAKKADYSDYVPTQEELALKEMCTEIGRRTLQKHAKELWGEG